MDVFGRKKERASTGTLLACNAETTSLARIADSLGELTDILRGKAVAEYEAQLEAKDKEIRDLKSALEFTKAEEKKFVDKFKKLSVGLGETKERPVPFDETTTEAKSEKFVPPTLDEVREYIASAGLDVDADEYFKEMTEADWLAKHGGKIKSWKLSIVGKSSAKKMEEKQEQIDRAFTAPSYDEVKAFATKIGSRLDPQYFLDYYNDRAWMGENGKPIRDWKAAFGSQSGVMKSKELRPKNKPYDYDECLKYFKSLGKPECANKFWGYYASRDWKRNNGKALRDWRQAARQWVLNQLKWDAEEEEKK